MKRLPKASIKRIRIPSRLSVVELGPAPHEMADLLRELGVLDSLSAKGRKAVADFLYLVYDKLLIAKMLDASPPHRSKHHAPTPALRQKLKWAEVRLSRLIEMARSEDLPHAELLLHAQLGLKQFREKQFQKTPRQMTGSYYLKWQGWFTRPPAVAYGLFVLLRRHSRQRLTKREAFKRVSRVHSHFLDLNVEIASVEKQVQRFAADDSYWHMNRLLRRIEKLPRFQAQTKS